MINKHSGEECLLISVIAHAITDSGVSCAFYMNDLVILKGYHYRIGCWLADMILEIETIKFGDVKGIRVSVNIADPDSIGKIVNTVGELYNLLPIDPSGRDPDTVEIKAPHLLHK